MNDMRRMQKSVAAAASDDDTIDLSALFASIWRGKAIILGALVLSLTIGALYTYGIATPMYQSTAVVMLNNREEQVVDLGSVMGGLQADTSILNTEIEILKSRVLLGKVVNELNLEDDPEFNRALQPPSQVSRLMTFVRSLIVPKGELTTSAREARRREATINSLLSALSIQNVSNSLVFRVTVETTSAAKSAQIADTLVSLYILNQLEVKFEATEQATTWLTERVTDLQISLEDAEEKVKTFRASTSLVSPESLSGIEIQVKDTRERIESMQQSLQSSQQKLAGMRNASSPEEKAGAAGDLQLQQMLNRMDDRAIAASFDARFALLVTRAMNDIARTDSQLLSLRDSLATLERQSEQQSQDLITLQQLTREAEASRLLYEYFLSRLKETSAQQGVQQADSRIISPAVIPVRASSPQKMIILAVSTLLGLLIGVTFVLLREARNRTFRSAQLLESMTGQPVIGQIPLIPAKQRRDAISYLREKPSSAATEAVRNLRTSVMLSNVDLQPKVIMTSSSLPGEGKTTVALALTLNFSTMGKKVLLIEADIRRRVFGQYLKTSQTDGIISVVSGERSFDDVVVHDELLGADVLLGDKGQANAADIFSSDRFAKLLEGMRERYDVIIIDTPPVLIVPDARVIAQNVDATVFVVRWDRTQHDQVQSAIREFESVGKPISGLVLNQISPRGMKRYGYGNSYGPYSAYGSKYYVN